MFTTIEDVKNFVLEWNLRSPKDHWWREKHNIPFNSSDHRASSFIDQLIEYEEDKIFRDIIKEEVDKLKDDYEPIQRYIPGQGNFLNKRIITQQETEQSFNDLNLDNFKFE